MNKSVIAPRKRRGVALIICVSILALLSIIATGFVLNMEFELKATANYSDGVKAQNAAEAGIKLAIARLKTLARTDFVATPASPNDWNYISTTRPSFDNSDGTPNNSTSVLSLDLGRGSIGVCSLRVIDTASQININDTNPGLGAILESLVAIIGAPLALGDGNAIVTNRPAGGYTTKEEIMLRAAFTQAEYSVIRGFITVNSYIDQNSEDTTYDSTYQPKAPININTASPQVLDAVLRTILFFVQDIRSPALAGVIVNKRPFTNWQQFDNFIDTDPDVIAQVGLAPGEKIAIKNNANPNRLKIKSGGAVLPYTTDFCFHPSGIYEITSTGRIGIDANGDGDLADAGDTVNAENSITAIVRIYEILYYTTKEQFRGEDVNYNGILDAGEDINGNGILDVPTYQRVTWMNSCPVNASSLFGQYDIPSPEYVNGALKIGYWDDFDEDTAYSQSEWYEPTPGFDIWNGDSSGGDNELCGRMTDDWVTLRLVDTSKWTWGYCSLRVWLKDDLRIVNPVQMQDVGWVQLNKDSGNSILWAKQGVLEWGGPYYRDQGGVPIWPLTDEERALPYYIFPPQLRRFPGDIITSPYWTPHAPWYGTKTHNIRHTTAGGTATVWDPAGGSATITYPAVGYGTMYLQFYSHKQNSYWDDLRIIPADGNYISPTYRPLGAGNNVEWGTMGFTGTLQTGTTINTYASLGGGAFNPVSLNGPIGATLADSIRYRINFTSSGNMENTPILEDITITYLPSTEIRSWSK